MLPRTRISVRILLVDEMCARCPSDARNLNEMRLFGVRGVHRPFRSVNCLHLHFYEVYEDLYGVVRGDDGPVHTCYIISVFPGDFCLVIFENCAEDQKSLYEPVITLQCDPFKQATMTTVLS